PVAPPRRPRAEPADADFVLVLDFADGQVERLLREPDRVHGRRRGAVAAEGVGDQAVDGVEQVVGGEIGHAGMLPRRGRRGEGEWPSTSYFPAGAGCCCCCTISGTGGGVFSLNTNGITTSIATDPSTSTNRAAWPALNRRISQNARNQTTKCPAL